MIFTKMYDASDYDFLILIQNKNMDICDLY